MSEAGKASEEPKATPPIVEDVAAATHELADVAERLGRFDAAKKLREYGQAIARGAEAGNQTAQAIVRLSNAYGQSAIKRVVDAVAAVAKVANQRKSPLRRIGRPRSAAKVQGPQGPTVAKAKVVG